VIAIPASRANSRLAIIGAGFAGLGLAIALARKGFTPTVFERRAEAQITSEGIFVTLAPNGLNALRALGLAERAVAEGVVTLGLAMHNERGIKIGHIDYAAHADAFGAPSVTIRRGALSQSLLDTARAEGIDFRFSTDVSAIAETGDAVTVSTAGQPERFDLLIAADGLRSTVRRHLFSGLPQPRFNGLMGSGGILDVPEIAPTNNRMLMYFGRRAFFGFIKDQGGPVHWFNSFPAAGDTLEASDLPRLLADLHHNDPAPIPSIIAANDPALRLYPDYDMPILPRWHTDRVLLIGDAAHAMTPHSGQGASMALEDAIVLAACLEAEASPSTAFSRFESLRRRRVETAIALGRRGGAPKKAQGWLSLRLRDLLLPLFLPLGQKAQEGLFAFRVDRDPLASPNANGATPELPSALRPGNTPTPRRLTS
jgi:2-polyprenyl-6-methoxyphenol hydroxylase-like FAD-dependent oxidoreductase